MTDEANANLGDSIDARLSSFVLMYPEPEMVEQITEARPLIEQFCQRYELTLLDVQVSDERGVPEPLYLFTDHLGGYTIDGVRRSLE